MSTRTQHHAQGRRRLHIALALLCIASLGIGFYLYYGQATWRSRAYVSHGEPVDPPVPLPNLALRLLSSGRTDAASVNAAGYTDFNFFRRNWTLLYWGLGLCPESCRTSLDITRQVRIALDRDMDRVQRVFIADGVCCEMDFLRAQEDLITVPAGSDASPLLALLSRVDRANATAADRIYIIDPSGKLVMSYAANARPQDLLEDLKHLMGSFHVDSIVSRPKSTSSGGVSQTED
jgi:cytochrome oxidase Cu insertion factor (SCO1/SenC/PrrC family)